jgi:hypothetical protein
MKNKTFMKTVIFATSFSILCTTFTPLPSTFAAENDNTAVINNQVTNETPESLLEYIEIEGAPSTVEDTRDFIQYAATTEEFQSYIGEEIAQDDVAHASGFVGGTLKAIKAFGWICRVGGKTLKYAIRPLSPSKAKLIDQYARKIAYATERLESGTKSALISALKKAGVPGKTAEALAEIILWLV